MMNKDQLKQLKFETNKILTLQPGLKAKYINELPVEIYGNYAVRDSEGNIQGDYDVLIKIPRNYPFNFPVLYVTSKKYDWIDDRHTDQNGMCCVEITQRILLAQRNGMWLFDFFQNYVHKFFCWQILYDEVGPDILKQWDHGLNGTKTFYHELLGTADSNIIRRIIEAVLYNKIPKRKSPCICGSGKAIKKCHQSILYDLKCIGKKQLSEDIKIFIQ